MEWEHRAQAVHVKQYRDGGKLTDTVNTVYKGQHEGVQLVNRLKSDKCRTR